MNYVSESSYFIIGLKQRSIKLNKELPGIFSEYCYWIKARGLIRVTPECYDVIFESGKDLLYSKDYIIRAHTDEIPMQTPEATSTRLLMLKVKYKDVEGILPYTEQAWKAIKDKDAYKTPQESFEDSLLHDKGQELEEQRFEEMGDNQ